MVQVGGCGVQGQLLADSIPLKGDRWRAINPTYEEEMIALGDVCCIRDDGQSGVCQRHWEKEKLKKKCERNQDHIKYRLRLQGMNEK